MLAQFHDRHVICGSLFMLFPPRAAALGRQSTVVFFLTTFIVCAGGRQPKSLHEVTVPTMTNEACKATEYDDDEITDNMICAGVAEGGKDSCQVCGAACAC